MDERGVAAGGMCMKGTVLSKVLVEAVRLETLVEDMRLDVEAEEQNLQP